MEDEIQVGDRWVTFNAPLPRGGRVSARVMHDGTDEGRDAAVRRARAWLARLREEARRGG